MRKWLEDGIGNASAERRALWGQLWARVFYYVINLDPSGFKGRGSLEINQLSGLVTSKAPEPLENSTMVRYVRWGGVCRCL